MDLPIISRALLTVAALGTLTACATGQAPGTAPARRPMTFADLQQIKRISDPQISPSGKWVMFSVMEVSLEKNTKLNHLWVVPVAGGKEVQATFGSLGESNARFSPDGKQVLYTSAVGGSSQLWLAPWDEGKGMLGSPRDALTSVSTEADGGIWSPDSKSILFVSSVYPECSDKPSWAEEDACDKAKDDAAAKSPVKAQIFEHLLYRHWTAYTGEKRSHILLTSLPIPRSGRADIQPTVRDLTPRRDVGDAETPTFSLGGPLGYAWSPDSKELAYVSNLDPVPAASTNNDIFTLRLDSPDARPVKISSSPGSDDGPAYSPDGKYIAFRSQARNGFESDRFRLVLYDREQKTGKEVVPKINRPAGRDFDGWIDEFAWAADSSNLVFTSGVRGEEAVYSYDAFGFRRGNQPLLVRRTEQGEYGDLRVSMNAGASATTLVAAKMTADRPSAVVALDLGLLGHTAFHESASEKFQQPVSLIPANEIALTHLNDAVLESLDLAKLESFWFVGAADTKVQGFVVRPPHFDPSQKYPLKFLMHGGPQTAFGDAWSYRWNAELMAASGYVVVMINRRGSTGYGQKFVDEVSGDWGGKAYVDLMKGLDYAETKYPFIDKTRECALGASYGGFMANWVLTHTNRFKCIVSHDGMYNPQSAYGTTEEMWFNEWEFRPTTASGMVEQTKPAQPWDYASGPAANDPFRKWSPMLSIQNAKTPTLVIHSQKDFRLDVSEGFQLFTALQRLGVPSKMLYFPDEGHWVLKPQNSQLWYQTVDDWCDRWTHTNKYAGAAK